MQNFCPTIQQLSNALHSLSFFLPSSLYLCVFLALPTLLSPSFLGLHAASRLKVIRPGWQFFPWPSCENFLPCRTFIELIFLFAFAQLYRFRSLVLWLELKEPSQAKARDWKLYEAIRQICQRRVAISWVMRSKALLEFCSRFFSVFFHVGSLFLWPAIIKLFSAR